MHVEAIRQAAVEALEEIKARDITVLDVRKLTSLFDYMIVATAESARQAKALAHNVQEKLKALGVRAQGLEGEQTGEWVLVDLGDVIVHVMQPAVRSYYNLEQLWGGRPPSPHPTTWRNPPAAPL
ncbi:MAG TPA: ribosome silencing factor [Burkholderiales bacterium]|nr:ribosome silencing factor [Burkholderiales bacterium]